MRRPRIDRADVGSLSAAARRLGVVKSALSHHVAALERDGSAKVIHRLRRGAVLTAVGEILAAHGRTIVPARQTWTSFSTSSRRSTQ